LSFFPEVISLFSKSALRKGLFLIALGVATHLALVSASFASRIEARGDFYCQFDKGTTDAMGVEKLIKFAVPRTITVLEFFTRTKLNLKNFRYQVKA
jgi:hypothetical protein